MKIPQSPPSVESLIKEIGSERMLQLFSLAKRLERPRSYLHWDKLRRQPLPEGMSHREWWFVEKMSRMSVLRSIPLQDKKGKKFQFSVPESIQKELHQIDLGMGSPIYVPESIINPHTRDRYLINSLIEEAITSSQLEGAVTTREVAKEMIRTGRLPHDISEKMILNNYRTMQHIHTLKDSPLSEEVVFQLHKMVTENTLENSEAAGRLRRTEEIRVVANNVGDIYHEPPPVEELKARMSMMCSFANEKIPNYFIHPLIRAIILHFWLAYDHPFVDGNGRTARALFYWAMLRNGYSLFEFISISSILRKAPVQYNRSFLYTETDDNDLTYFLLAQTKVILKAIKDLHTYIQRKKDEVNQVQSRLRALDLFNHRQSALILHALKHPGHRYSIDSHQKSHNIVYQTARTDLLNLEEQGILKKQKKGRKMLFVVPADLSDRLLKLETQ